jgi:hypothetical protein
VTDWDVDRYEQLQDAAWELELLASKQHRTVDQEPSAMSLLSAHALRQQAADLLAQYWAPRPPVNG